MNVDAEYSQSKNGYKVHSDFEDKLFTSALGLSIESFLLDYETRDEQQCIDLAQISLFFINALADPAR